MSMIPIPHPLEFPSEDVMAALRRVEEWMRTITYKPNWSFTVDRRRSLKAGIVALKFSFREIDSRKTHTAVVRQPLLWASVDDARPDDVGFTTTEVVSGVEGDFGGWIGWPVSQILAVDRAGFVRFLRQELGSLELHERDEWLRVDGLLANDPHLPGWRP